MTTSLNLLIYNLFDDVTPTIIHLNTMPTISLRLYLNYFYASTDQIAATDRTG
jgi:hypothetical protein